MSLGGLGGGDLHLSPDRCMNEPLDGLWCRRITTEEARCTQKKLESTISCIPHMLIVYLNFSLTVSKKKNLRECVFADTARNTGPC